MIKKNKNKPIDSGTELVAEGDLQKKQLNKWIKIGVPIAIIVLCVAIPLLVSKVMGTGVTNSGGLVPQVEVMEVVAEDITEELTVTGTVSSDNTKAYFSPVTGTVESCNVKVGQVVKAGDVLITFDQEELESANLQSEFSYKQSVSEYNVTIANDTELKSEIAKATSEVSSIAKSINSTESTISGIQSKLTSLATQEAAKQTEIDTLESEIEAVTQETENTDNSLETMESTVDVEELQKELETAENELATIQSQISSYTTSMETEVQELSELEIELAQNEAIVESGSTRLTSEQLEVLAMSNNLAELAELEADELLELGKQGVMAEFDGVISAINVTEGMQVSQGMELVTVASNEEVSVDVEISADEFDSVRVGNQAAVTINDYEYNGEVNEVSQIATVNASGTSVINVRIQILDSDENMFLGVTAKNTIITESKENVLCVPSSSINTSTEGEFVYVLADGIVEKRMIELGITALDKIEVVSGLQEGDLVITDMVTVLSEGMLAEAKTE